MGSFSSDSPLARRPLPHGVENDGRRVFHERRHPLAAADPRPVGGRWSGRLAGAGVRGFHIDARSASML
ncbi:MAG: hypothetical protein D6723_10335 [Acidobacteria bacterium]|nr:MAG: hypothetical protein D6723_10335 [Acidobacteriota bacterium]